MSKSITTGGTDRFNLMLALTGYLIHNRKVPLVDLAKQFDVGIKEITSALVTISLSGVGAYYPNELFFLDYDLLEEGIVDISFSPAMEDVPKLSVRQASAISAGLSYLRSVVAEPEQVEVDVLLDLLAKGSPGNRALPISVSQMPADQDIEVIRGAINAGKRISCKYRNNSGTISTREIDPLILESSDTTWYLRGYCLSNLEVRAFRIDRLRDAQMLAKDISKEAMESQLTSAIYTVNKTDTEVILELEPGALGLISDLIPEEAPVQLSSGRYQVSVKIGHLPNLGKIVSKYGGAAIVKAPESAKQVVRDFARNALGLKAEKPHPEED
jgi:proteasome accessory factor C